jgi:hypothetical protein
MTVIFFCPNILRDYHGDLFCLDRLIQEGFNPILLDATKYYNHNSTATDKLIVSRTVECATAKDFEVFRAELPKEPVLFVAFDFYLKKSSPVFDMLIRKQDKILSYFTKRFSDTAERKALLDRYVKKIIVEGNNFLPLHSFKFWYRKHHSKYIPDYFLCSTEYLLPIKTYLTVKKKNIFNVHADDINKIIELPIKSQNKKRIGVFLDQGLPFVNRTHPKLYTKPLPPRYLDEYYKKVSDKLEQFKNELGLDEIVVALHPDAPIFKSELKGKFQNHRTVLGNTPQLIKDATIVFGHCSTALSFAIYFEKPVIIFTDHYVKDYDTNLKLSTYFFIENLGMNEVDLDENTVLSWENITIDKTKYLDYKTKYLKDNDIQENSYFYAIKQIQNDLQK